MISHGCGRGALVVLLSTLTLTALPAIGSADPVPSIYAFGRDVDGQVGVPPSQATDQAVVTPALVSLPGATGPAVQAAAGTDQSLVLTSSGQVFAFGSNRYGQLGVAEGLGQLGGVDTPQLVTIAAADGPVTQVAAGDQTSYALTSTGQVFAWGSNEYGQLGTSIDDGTSYFYPDATPHQVGFPGENGPVVQIAATAGSALALTSSGQLYGWGNNDNGDVGTATNLGNQNPNPTPVNIAMPSGTGPIASIAAGNNEVAAVTSQGQLYAWGTYPGQADGTSGPNPVPTLVQLPGGSGGVTQVAIGGQHTLALTSTGQLFGWGNNQYGQLDASTGAGDQYSTPPALLNLGALSGQIASIAAGMDTSLLVTRAGQLETFGDDYYGQLGYGQAPSQSSTPAPAQLPAGTSVATVGGGGQADFTLVVPSSGGAPTAPPPATAPGATAPPHHRGAVQVGRVVTHGRWLAVALRCARRACAGTITVTARRLAHSRGTVIVARRRFQLRAGSHRTLRLSLNDRGRFRLARSSRLRARLRITGVAGHGRRLVFRRARVHHRD
jgi:alpha-tubulin suppressor-like RCC1 family protein